MEALDYWRLCDELSVVQAALLLVDEDPGSAHSHVERWEVENRPKGYEAAKTAIRHAMLRGAVSGLLIPLFEYDINGNPMDKIEGSVDVSRSLVEVESLKAWLRSRGFRTGFFFPEQNDVAYLDPAHPRYAPKLAGAVKAWLATDESALNGKHPKQALMKWLREHAAEFQLVDEDGKPNETGIDETAKVANWQPGGGAPKTPAG